MANAGVAPLDGLSHALLLVNRRGKGEVFALHAAEIHLYSAIAPEAKGHWTVRVQVSEGYPGEANAFQLRWTDGERLGHVPPNVLE